MGSQRDRDGELLQVREAGDTPCGATLASVCSRADVLPSTGGTEGRMMDRGK